MSGTSGQQRNGGVTDALPGLARLAAGAWLRTASWGLGASVRVGGRVARAVVDPGSAGALAQELRSSLRDQARELLGVAELDDRIKQLLAGAGGGGDDQRRNGRSADAEALRVRGAELLREAADVEVQQREHPAYGRILSELAPDEGRILRLLVMEGAQPSVDVRASNLLGVSSQLVAAGLNMIGAQAGCRDRDRVPAYLNNLERLGLIWFSREPVDDPIAYQVLEAQPQVLDAIKRASRAKTVQRSIHLTPFGRDFCEVCLPLDTVELEALSMREE